MINLILNDSPVLIFGGTYSNLSATRAILARSESLGIPPQRVICTGDLVAYCAEPAETVALIRDWGIHVVMGNCEESIGSDALDCGCGFDQASLCSTLSDGWYRYANQYISTDARRWMKELPREIRFELNSKNFHVIHGSVSSINQFIFPSTAHEIKQRELTISGSRIVIGGHSGIPFGQNINSSYWLNAGVIGMPANDGSRDGWYMLLESSRDSVIASWHRLEYDALKSRDTTHRAGMREYAEALESGFWPSMDILPEHEQQCSGLRLAPKPLIID